MAALNDERFLDLAAQAELVNEVEKDIVRDGVKEVLEAIVGRG